MYKIFITGIFTFMAHFAFANPNPPSVKLQQDVLYYTGDIEQDTIIKLKKLYEKATKKPIILEIDSPGGITEYGMELGAFVKDNGLDVRVVGMCFSSCANFVLPAGKTTYIGKDAFIGWHGDGTSSTAYERIKYGVTIEQSLRKALIESYTQSGQKYTQQQLEQDIAYNVQFAAQQNAQEDIFYEKYNINPLLARYPHMTEAGRQDLENSPENSAGWTYTPEMLQQLGINLVLMDNTWVFSADKYDQQKPDFMGATLHLIRQVTP